MAAMSIRVPRCSRARQARSRLRSGERRGQFDDWRARKSPRDRVGSGLPHDQLHDLAPVRDVHVPVIVQRDLAGETKSSLRPFPLSHTLTRRRELLYTAVRAVHHKDIPFYTA